MKKRFFMAFVVCVALVGCATPYQPQAFRGGFSETQLDTNIFKVRFSGNGYTSGDRAEEMALLRSAELTLKNGFSYFIIVDGRSIERYSTYTTPTQSSTTVNMSIYGNSAYGTAHTTTYGGQTYVVAKPSTTNTIVCFKEKPDIQKFAFNAQFLCKSLGEKYGVVCGAQ